MYCQIEIMETGTIFIFGMRHTFHALANTSKQLGLDVTRTCQRGFGAHLVNPGHECLMRDDVSHIVSSIPPVGDSGFDLVVVCHGELRALASRMDWIHIIDKCLQRLARRVSRQSHQAVAVRGTHRGEMGGGEEVDAIG